MIKNMPIGKYFPGNSILHKIDSRIKILTSIVFFMLLFFVKNYASLFFATCFTGTVVVLSSVSLKTYLKSNVFIIITTLFTAIINLFFSENSTFFTVGTLSISEVGIRSSILILARLTNLVLMSSALMFTTSPESMSHALESLLHPLKIFKINVQEIAMTITISLRFIPILMEEADKIITAQRARGADIKSRNIVKKVKAFVPILVPLFASAFKRAADLALAMECRCYDSTKQRTKLNNFKLQNYDILAAISILIAFLGVIACEIFW